LGDRVYFLLKVHFQETHNYLRTRSYLYVWIVGLSKAKWRMHFRVYEKAWRDERMVSSYFQNVLRIKAILKERNIGLTFIIIPFAGQVLEPPEPHDYPFVDIDQLVPFLEKHSIPYISFVEPFMGQHNAYIHGDPYHLSQYGHELVAQKILQTIQHANSE